MTAPMRRSIDPIADLQRELTEVRRLAEEASRKPIYIPVVADDPPDTDPTNVWVFPDGRLRVRHRNTAGTAWVVREYTPAGAPGGTTSGSAPAAPAPAPTTRVGQWAATWSHSYRSTGAQRTDSGATMLYYGNGDSFNNMNQSLIGFDYAAIATALAGSTIKSVQLRLLNVHAWYNTGVDIYFGIHNFTSKPSTWAGGGIPRRQIVKHHFGKPQERVVPMPLEFAQSIRDGWGKGIAIEAPNSSRSFYGYAAGVGSGSTVPVLIIEYAK